MQNIKKELRTIRKTLYAYIEVDPLGDDKDSVVLYCYNCSFRYTHPNEFSYCPCVYRYRGYFRKLEGGI